jgi:hypothetical protein
MLPHLWVLFGGGGAAVTPPGPGSGRLQARAGVLRAGVTRSGMCFNRFQVLINGVDCTQYVRTEDTPTITESLEGGAPSFAFSLKGLTPALGQDVRVLIATPNEFIFGGTITTRQPILYGTAPGKYHWHCIATGYAAWLMDRYALVTRRYFTQGVNGILADLLANYTDGGFRVGYAPASLGDVAIDFEFESVLDAIERLARASEAVTGTAAYFEVTADKIVNIYETYPAGNLPTFSESSVDLASIEYAESFDEIRTQTVSRGAGSTATATVGPGAVRVALQDVAHFSSAGGLATSGYSLFSYTSKSPESGPGELTGITGLDYDITEGDEVRVYAVHTDLTKQSALAAALGGGLSGVAVHLLDAEGATLTETARRAESDVAQHGEARKTLAFRYADTPRRMAVGRFFTANMTRPLTISGEFRVQMITTTVLERSHRTPDQEFRSPALTLRRQISASRTARSLAQVLRRVA